MQGGIYSESSGNCQFGQIVGHANAYGNLTITGGRTTLSVGGQTSQIASLTMGGAGILDITNNTLDINYTGPSPVASIRAYLTSGFDNLKWDGLGIDSSVAADDPYQATGIGYIDTGSQIIIRYTWYGDANLDGVVNAADLAAMSNAGTSWATGDFNYDGIVNADDYALLLRGAAVSGGQLIPEPAGQAVLIGLGASLAARRRFRGGRIPG